MRPPRANDAARACGHSVRQAKYGAAVENRVLNRMICSSFGHAAKNFAMLTKRQAGKQALQRFQMIQQCLTRVGKRGIEHRQPVFGKMPADRRARGNKRLAGRAARRHMSASSRQTRYRARRSVQNPCKAVRNRCRRARDVPAAASRQAHTARAPPCRSPHIFPAGEGCAEPSIPKSRRINLRIGGIGRNVDDAFLKRNRLQPRHSRHIAKRSKPQAGLRRRAAMQASVVSSRGSIGQNQIAAEKITAARRRFTLERAAFRNRLRHVGHMHTEPITVILLLNGKGKIAANGQPLRDCEQRLAAQVGTAGRRYPTRLHLLRFGAGFRRKRLPKRRAAQRGDYTGTQRFGRTEILHRQGCSLRPAPYTCRSARKSYHLRGKGR